MRLAAYCRDPRSCPGGGFRPVDEPVSQTEGLQPPRVRGGLRVAHPRGGAHGPGAFPGRPDDRDLRPGLDLAAGPGDRGGQPGDQRSRYGFTPGVASGRRPARLPARRHREAPDLVPRPDDRRGDAPVRGRVHRPRSGVGARRRDALLQRLHRRRPGHLAALARDGRTRSRHEPAGSGGAAATARGRAARLPVEGPVVSGRRGGAGRRRFGGHAARRVHRVPGPSGRRPGTGDTRRELAGRGTARTAIGSCCWTPRRRTPWNWWRRAACR